MRNGGNDYGSVPPKKRHGELVGIRFALSAHAALLPRVAMDSVSLWL